MAEAEGFEPPDPFEPAVFKTAALNHSATPPSVREACVRYAVPRRTSTSSDAVDATHVRPEGGGHPHGAVGLHVVLEDRDQRAADREPGSVEGVDQPGFGFFHVFSGRPVAGAHPAGLEVREVAARRDLAVPL